MIQIEKMTPLKSNDVQSFERLAHLVRMDVVKLQTEDHGAELRKGKEQSVPTSKPPCVYYGENHGMWSFRRFQNMGVNERWNVARDKELASDREGRACTKA